MCLPFDMSIRKKFILTTLCLTLCLIVIFYIVISRVVYENFGQLEKDTVANSLERVQLILQSQIMALDNLTHGWSSNDDTYGFVRDHPIELLASDIVRKSLNSDANIDLLLLFNNDRNLVLGGLYDKKTNKIKNLSESLLRSIDERNNFFEYVSRNTRKRGLIQFGEECLVLAIRPILNGNGEGPPAGTLVMGRFLNTERIARLQKLTLTSVNIYPVHNIDPEVEAPMLALLASPDAYYMYATSEDVVNGYTFLDDLSGNAVFMLAIGVGRKSYQQSQKTIFFLLYATICIGLVFGMVFFLFIDIIISRRLSAIILAIREIERSSDHGVRIKESFLNDDLGRLAVSINNMLDANETLEEYKGKSEKLETLATFAAGATHELATPLGTIAVASGEILCDLRENTLVKEDLYEDIVLIRNQVNRCKDLLYQMAAGAGEHMGEELVSFTIDKLISASLVVFEPQVAARIVLDVKIGDRVLVMPVLSMRRVLRGILKNGIDASESDLPVVLSCREDDTYIIFEVRDQGTGMDEQVLKHAMDPFFTTKDPGKGIGLGLYLARSLANRFGGALVLSTSPIHGTTVLLRFAKELVYAKG
jgi:signal transduction histidine kinase